jgi:hypothetical protein
MIVLPIADLNSQSIEAVLDDDLYYIIIDWNETGQYWEMGIRNSLYRTLVDGICMVPNYPLLRQFKYPDLPPGDLQVVCDSDVNGPPARNQFANERFQLIYTTAAELLVILNAVR